MEDVKILERILSKLESLEAGQERLESEVVKTNIKIEQDIEPKIGILLDGQVANTDVLKEHTKQLEQIRDAVDRLDTVTKVHTAQIKGIV